MVDSRAVGTVWWGPKVLFHDAAPPELGGLVSDPSLAMLSDMSRGKLLQPFKPQSLHLYGGIIIVLTSRNSVRSSEKYI